MPELPEVQTFVASLGPKVVGRTVIGVTLARLSKHRATRIAWALYPLLVTFVIVATGNHFLADAMLGAITAGLSAWAASWLARARPTAWGFRAAKA